jgi:GT2 family glycosyltransferase
MQSYIGCGLLNPEKMLQKSETSGPRPLVTVVIPTRNRLKNIQLAVTALARQTWPVSHMELVVVDNLSTDGTPDWVEELQVRAPYRVTLVRQEIDGGPASSRSAGWRVSRGQILVFLDSDIEPIDQWIEIAVAFLEENPDTGMVGGILVYASRPDLVNIYGGALTPLGLGWDGYTACLAAEVPRRLDLLWTPTAALAVRREVFERVGSFDETYYYSYEDSDFGWRANLAGFRCACLSELVAKHDSLPTLRPAGATIVFHASKNRLRSLLKNYSTASMLRYLPLHLTYALAEAAARPNHAARFRALWWNLLNLGETWRERKKVQATRRCSDTELRPLFTASLLPDGTLARRRSEEVRRVSDSPPGPVSAA